jgi:hypothetical protein
MNPGEREGEGIAIKEEGVEDNLKKDPRAEGVVSQKAPPGGPGRGKSEKLGKSQVWTATGDGGSWTTTWRTAPPPALDEADVRTVALTAEPVDGGCRFTGREAGEPELVRWALTADEESPWRPFAALTAGAAAVIHLVQLGDLTPGEPLAVEYLDTWGEPWLDVPSAEGIEVVPPQPVESEGSAIEVAADPVVAGDQLCVCGRFSPIDAGTSFLLGDLTTQAVGAYRRLVWLEVPATTPPGERRVSGEGIAGSATTHVVRVLAELDQDQLLTGGSTTLRLRVEGTEQPLRIHLTNSSPGIIQLEGGDQQTTETSGGNPNQVERQVQANQRGSFDLQWKLDPPSCPCEDGGEASGSGG